jgi:hypothetical protein
MMTQILNFATHAVGPFLRLEQQFGEFDDVSP